MIGVLEYAPLLLRRRRPRRRGALARRAPAWRRAARSSSRSRTSSASSTSPAAPRTTPAGCSTGSRTATRETRGPVTFGRGELRRRLAAAGLGHTRFYYPFPDYKLPRLLLSEEALTDPRLDAGRLAAWVDTRDYLRPRARFFSEETAWEAIGRNGLVGEFANSFLVAASPGPDAALTGAPPWLAELRATDRVRAYRTVTRIADEDGGLVVRKTALAPAAAPPDLSPVALRLPIEGPFLQGRPLAVRVRGLLEREGATVPEAAEALRPWAGLLTGAVQARDAAVASSGPLAGDAGDAELPGGLLDLVPWNLMLAEAGLGEPPSSALEPFDQEWTSLRRLSLGHVVFRGLFHLLSGVRTPQALTAGGTVGDLLTELAGALGAPLDAARLSAVTRREAEIQSAVTGMPFAIALESLERALERLTTEPLAEPPGDGGAAEAAATIRATRLAQAAAAADLERRRLEARLDALERELDALPEAWSTAREAGADRLNLRRLREGSRRKLRAFADASRSDGVAAAVASGGRSIWNSARYWTGNAPEPAAHELPPEAYGPPCSWRQVPASTRRIDVVVSLAGGTAAETAATLDSLLHQSHLLYEVAVYPGAGDRRAGRRARGCGRRPALLSGGRRGRPCLTRPGRATHRDARSGVRDDGGGPRPAPRRRRRPARPGARRARPRGRPRAPQRAGLRRHRHARAPRPGGAGRLAGRRLPQARMVGRLPPLAPRTSSAASRSRRGCSNGPAGSSPSTAPAPSTTSSCAPRTPERARGTWSACCCGARARRLRVRRTARAPRTPRSSRTRPPGCARRPRPLPASSPAPGASPGPRRSGRRSPSWSSRAIRSARSRDAASSACWPTSWPASHA